MTKRLSDCVLLADRHHGLSEGIRGLLETTFSSVFMVADETSLIEGAGLLRPAVVVIDLLLVRAVSCACCVNCVHGLQERKCCC